MIHDAAQRQQALNPIQSFIVQAPAGSGKTELLTQRFLNLLTTVDHDPEEVVAITFTKKAANEMRQRILAALQLATQAEPIEPHKKITWQIAQQALQRDQTEQWDLLNNPNRLRIQTIDALCTYLSKQLPILSQLGSNIQIMDNPELAYQQAVTITLESLEENVPWSDAVATLLLHLDNNLTIVQDLLVSMLTHRDQWLPHVIHAKNNQDIRAHLEIALQNLVTDALQQLCKHYPREHQAETIALLNHAVQKDYALFPQHTPEHLSHWREIAALLLTQKHEWRKLFDKRSGFPIEADNKAEKVRLRDLKNRASGLVDKLNNNETLRLLLKEALLLPPTEYSDNQWQVLTALLQLLPILAAQLTLIFQQEGQVDFIEITQRALQALSSDGAPTDLALCLDHQIKHILIDEFQDTSVSQFRLLELLTRGWQRDDGRTLFIVGDPMQSIYRFRAAEVGLFLQAKQFGVGDIKLTPLSLSSNFRSTQTIVDWFNQTFSSAFPQTENIALGAIPYVTTTAVNADNNSAIYYHLADPEQKASEANTIVQIIQANPEQEIALLVKSRQHLAEIIPYLKQANIAFQAVEIATLGHLPFIQDLCSLTLALLHFGHRLAWLAILRAPWCGLTLQDLHTLANPHPDRTIWQCINDATLFAQLTADGKIRLQHLRDALHIILEQRGRLTLSQWVQNAWIMLGGPATLRTQDNLDDCNAFFNLLSELEHGGHLPQLNLLEENLAQLFAQSKSSTAKIHVMTIHKAKGLEFDQVIIPSLQSYTMQDKAKLLLWQERPGNRQQLDLLLAPIKARKDHSDPIYDYIKYYEQRKAYYENIRLFYVASTRAKKALHLIASFADEDARPRSTSFLDIIWPLHQSKFQQYYSNIDVKIPAQPLGNLRRLPRKFKLPTNISQLIPTPKLTMSFNTNMPLWQDQDLRRVGIVLHRILQEFSLQPHNEWSKILTNESLLTLLLRQQSVINIAAGLNTIRQALQRIMHSETAQWILQPHQAAQSEYEMNYQQRTYIIDRTFIDNGTRWIIDYKSAVPQANEPIETFLQRQWQNYQMQLEQYAALLQQEGVPIKLMLYFPLINEKITWPYNPDQHENSNLH